MMYNVSKNEKMNYENNNLRIKNITELIPPIILLNKYPATVKAILTVQNSRKLIKKIIFGKDDRLLVVIGPCSIHDPKSAVEYAKKLQKMHEILKDDLEIIMRVYFEKPRTTIGWKGLITDPNLDNSCDINKGLCIARNLLVKINDLALPTAGEFLYMITSQYFEDLTSWVAIGARTTESQVHRELASGLPCPVGFKNGTDGTIKVAIDAINVAKNAHCFLSVTKSGQSAILNTTGNEDCHIILRGGKQPNYSKDDIQIVKDSLQKSGLLTKIMIDCSHANCSKKYKKQIEVAENISNQIEQGEKSIIGIMVESYLLEGQQDISKGKNFTYGQSITDACLGWQDSAKLLYKLAAAVRIRRNRK